VCLAVLTGASERWLRGRFGGVRLVEFSEDLLVYVVECFIHCSED
jgi:hypothetical protein